MGRSFMQKIELDQHGVGQKSMELRGGARAAVDLVEERGDVLLDGPDRSACISVGREAGIEVIGGLAFAREFAERGERPSRGRCHRPDAARSGRDSEERHIFKDAGD
jgi:hypothetical protein